MTLNSGSSVVSPLNYTDRAKLDHPRRQSGPLDDLDHALHVLVGKRRLLRQPAVRRTAHDDPVRLELLPQLGAPDLLPGASPREPAPGAMAGGAERALHRSLAAGEHEAACPHAPGDEHGLPG